MLSPNNTESHSGNYEELVNRRILYTVHGEKFDQGIWMIRIEMGNVDYDDLKDKHRKACL